MSENIENMNEGKDQESQIKRSVYVGFVYSFAWDVTKIPFQDVAKSLKNKGWDRSWLHQRFVDFNGTEGKFGSYRPSLQDGAQQELQRTEGMCEKGGLEIVVPVDQNWKTVDAVNEAMVVACDVCLKYHLRILENGAGVCTFTVCLDGDTATYINTHYALHLGQNVAFGAGTDASGKLAVTFLRCKAAYNDRDTDAGPKKSQKGNPAWVRNLMAKVQADNSLAFPEPDELPVGNELIPQCPGGFTLHELFNRLLLLNPDWFPPNWVLPGKEKKDSVWLDWAVLPWQVNAHPDKAIDLAWQWQNPYVFTICSTPEGNSIFPGQDAPNHEGVLRRVAVLCKMNSDNRNVDSDWEQISPDYAWRSLPSKDGKLQNMSHDSRVFFTFSRRGGLVETTDMHEIPGYFVLPSFVNLLEILRARWHLGNVLNAGLDQTIEQLVAQKITPTEAVDQVFHWRALYSMFRRDPVPYLFDGGSVTEISDLADREFWLRKLNSSAAEKIEVIDRLVQYRDFQDIDWPRILK
jgi:hypothetical protein